ncbi:class I SAM-dependent methyltransferase [Paenibacillus sp. KQZ6P-2]|uniref:Class I SAM-dependent methyltransferase n=1 Tax=Paenibacillus mangrovi TaxID=2931978 RepID=A0A9X2B447_9BACL|nr:class I SAM-dependent methyltransferase [Paenibacillus mangrovi]MCJ8011237.1 class I SAM-dependent methyltransferase [Paenibacillus mangrovi]
MGLTKTNLAKSYDIDSHRRVNSNPAEWKLVEREHFLSKLRSSDKKKLLEIGAGTGIDSLYFKENGIEVTSVDLSSEMIRYCKEKGLQAYEMDFYNLDFADNTFDAVYALNCLLHVPKNEIGDVLQEIKRIMKPDALFYMGLYGGNDSEGIWENDWCDPKRFFASYSDHSIRTLVGKYFKEISFNTIPLQDGQPHFQAFILQK